MILYTPSLIIIGVGNLYRSDDGIGIRLIQELQKTMLPPHVDLLDGGTDGLSLLNYMEGYKEALILDAVNMGKSTGDSIFLTEKEMKLKSFQSSLSTHGFGVAEVLTLAKTINTPCSITVFGIQPSITTYGKILSSELENNISNYISSLEEFIHQ
jgi:hydrogenase maturation protease